MLVAWRCAFRSVGNSERASDRTLHSQVLPLSEERKTQKVAVGDQSGVLQCFSVKKGEFAFAFKTLPGPKVRTDVDMLHSLAQTPTRGSSRKVAVLTTAPC